MSRRPLPATVEIDAPSPLPVPVPVPSSLPSPAPVPVILQVYFGDPTAPLELTFASAHDAAAAWRAADLAATRNTARPVRTADGAVVLLLRPTAIVVNAEAFDAMFPDR